MLKKMNQFVLDNQSGKEFESHVPIKRIDVKPTEPVTGQKNRTRSCHAQTCIRFSW